MPLSTHWENINKEGEPPLFKCIFMDASANEVLRLSYREFNYICCKDESFVMNDDISPHGNGVATNMEIRTALATTPMDLIDYSLML